MFLPPINIGSFKPAPATLAQWVYDIWQYLQENPIATQADITAYIQNYFETSPEVQEVVGDVVAQYLLDNPPQAPVQSVQGKTGAVSLTYPDIVPASNAVPVYRAANAPNTSTAQGLYNNGYRLFVNTTTQEIYTISNSGALALVGRGRFDGTTVDLDTAQGDTSISEAIEDNAQNITTLEGNVQTQASSIAANTQAITAVQTAETFNLSSTASTLIEYTAFLINHIVIINIRFKGTGGSVNIGTVPASYRPAAQQNLYCVSHTAQDTRALVVQTGGGIVTGSGTVNDAEYRALIVYVV